jgi:hypothetical protein
MTATIVKLRKWAVVPGTNNPYTAPEARGLRLIGEVHGHPWRPDGEVVTTSRVEYADGRHVRTYSGTQYLLDGSPREDYVAFCAEHNITLDLDAPIKIVVPGSDTVN